MIRIHALDRQLGNNRLSRERQGHQKDVSLQVWEINTKSSKYETDARIYGTPRLPKTHGFCATRSFLRVYFYVYNFTRNFLRVATEIL